MGKCQGHQWGGSAGTMPMVPTPATSATKENDPDHREFFTPKLYTMLEMIYFCEKLEGYGTLDHCKFASEV